MKKTYVILGCIFFLSITGMLGYIAFSYFKNPSPNSIKPGSCKILEESYCKQAKRVTYDGGTFIVFDLPVTTDQNGQKVRVPLYAKEKGHLYLGKAGKPFSGSFALVKTAARESMFEGNIDTSMWGTRTGADVDADQLIGYASAADQEHKSLGHDLTFTMSHKGANGPETMDGELKNLFNLK